MGLQLMEREKAVFQGEKDVQPDFAGKEYLLERFLKPEARRDIIESLAKAGIKPTAMMDISDGLSSELLHICTQSKVGCRVYEERIPIDYQTAVMAEEFNMNLSTCALNGGEDYELPPHGTRASRADCRRESHRLHHQARLRLCLAYARRHRAGTESPRLESAEVRYRNSIIHHRGHRVPQRKI